jgi:hypothetical protein
VNIQKMVGVLALTTVGTCSTPPDDPAYTAYAECLTSMRAAYAQEVTR